MPKFMKKVSRKAGLSPGTLLHIGEKRQENVKLTLMSYDNDQVVERQIHRLEEAFPLMESPAATWVNIDGLHRLEVIESIGEQFGVHPLTLEDILNTGHRPKFEDFETYLYIVVKLLHLNSNKFHVTAEQISLILGTNYLISIQEAEGDVFDGIRERIRKGKGRIRKGGPDYLAYALIDAIVDNYFVVLEVLGEEIDELEERLFEDPTPITLKRIHTIKQELILLRKQIWPLRDAIGNLLKGDSEFISDQTIIFLKDVHDHAIHIIDTIESYRDTLASLVDLYLSTVSNRMNEVMKVLTIISTIFIPVTFVAGVFGMNFKFMPELNWRWGYGMAWGIMVVIAIIMLIYFKKKDWI